MKKRTKLDKLADAARPKGPDEVPDFADPIEELHKLVRQHRARDRMIRRLGSDARESFKLKDGTECHSNLPADDRDAATEWQEMSIARQMTCRRGMTRELKRLPIYNVFLSKVAGMGPVLAAYLACIVDIRMATKPSSLKRFCGAVPDKDTGRLEKAKALTKEELAENKRRRDAGESNVPGRHYCQDIRTELFKWQGQLLKEGVRDGVVARPNKYLTAWIDFKRGREEEPGKGHRKGAWRATGIMLDDLYMVWRAIEGLPCWPDWYAAKLGYSHGGKICVNEPKMLTVEQALALVGDCGWLAGRVKKEPTSGVGLTEAGEAEDDAAAEWMAAKGEAV
jgi:hypothetical protein